MSEAQNDPAKGNWIVRLWRFLWRPNTSISLAVLLVVGFAGGVVFWGGFHWAVELSNTEGFCISCHEMRDNPYEEMRDSVHFVNRSGVRAICSDCHVPREWFYKIGRKIVATNELFMHIIGTIDTPEKYREERLSMAVSVWHSMKDTDSRECRNCHREVWMDMSKQFGGARRNHQFAIENNLTCIDCHQGVAHDLPEGFEPPTDKQLAEDANEWLAEIDALAAGIDALAAGIEQRPTD